MVTGKGDPEVVAAQQAAGEFLAALGIDLDRDVQQAPARMLPGYAELPDAHSLLLTTFPHDEGQDELRLVRAIQFRSVCEQHLMPFSGLAHVGYVPAGSTIELSDLPDIVAHFAARPQSQENLTTRVADCLAAQLVPRGVGVVLEAEHSCTTMNGVWAQGAKTVTSVLLGMLRTDVRCRAEFFALAGVAGWAWCRGVT